MNRICGFMLFWIGFGILIGLIIADGILCTVISGLLLLIGFNLFCRD